MANGVEKEIVKAALAGRLVQWTLVILAETAEQIDGDTVRNFAEDDAPGVPFTILNWEIAGREPSDKVGNAFDFYVSVSADGGPELAATLRRQGLTESPAAALIEAFLPEAANLNLGRLGVEIECLLRRDIRHRHSRLAQEFNAIMFRTKFVDGSDTSIERTPYTRDIYYDRFETSNETPVEWSVLAPRLQQLLAWLRREDSVPLTRDSAMTYDLVARNDDTVAEDPGLWKETRLPRAKVPSNASAAVHIHFDIKDWFESPEHAAAFVNHFNKVGPENFKPAIPPPRYRPGGQRGDYHARFVDNPPAKVGLNPAYKKATQAAFFSTGGDRKQAMNCKAALNRGDVEFRFIHATLSFNTISGWFQAIAELIEFSRLKAGGAGPDQFKDYLDAEAPETSKFLDDRAAMAAKGVKHEPDFGKPYRDSRAVRRLAKSLNIGHGGGDWAGLV